MHADIALICELDEQWGFVGSKARQHGLWYTTPKQAAFWLIHLAHVLMTPAVNC
jgi:insertion element IS1 protein InsB